MIHFETSVRVRDTIKYLRNAPFVLYRGKIIHRTGMHPRHSRRDNRGCDDGHWWKNFRCLSRALLLSSRHTLTQQFWSIYWTFPSGSIGYPVQPVAVEREKKRRERLCGSKSGWWSLPAIDAEDNFFPHARQQLARKNMVGYDVLCRLHVSATMNFRLCKHPRIMHADRTAYLPRHSLK